MKHRTDMQIRNKILWYIFLIGYSQPNFEIAEGEASALFRKPIFITDEGFSTYIVYIFRASYCTFWCCAFRVLCIISILYIQTTYFCIGTGIVSEST